MSRRIGPCDPFGIFFCVRGIAFPSMVHLHPPERSTDSLGTQLSEIDGLSLGATTECVIRVSVQGGQSQKSVLHTYLYSESIGYIHRIRNTIIQHGFRNLEAESSLMERMRRIRPIRSEFISRRDWRYANRRIHLIMDDPRYAAGNGSSIASVP